MSNARKILLDAPSLDTAVSPDGRFTFVLQAGGLIQILDAGGTPVQILKMDGDFDRITAGPTGSFLVLTSSRRSEAVFLTLERLAKIDSSGSPALGPEGTRVSIAVYSDFQ